jgi:Carbohydrate-binding module 48 (Isoamylase N-terminal domain)
MHDDHDELISRVVDELRAPVALDPVFDARVMAAVRRAAPGRWRLALRWWTEPRPFRLSPLTGLASAAALAGLLVLGARAFEPGQAGGAASTAPGIIVAPKEGGSEVVQFVLVAPQASTVAVVGDFNDWDPDRTPLHATAGGGVWSVNLPLRPGPHQYAFVVDGKDWRPDPGAPRAVTDDFGAPNSVIIVGGKST